MGYDVIVVGAGPAGCCAAWTAASEGARTLILEEHTSIGIPRHCSGFLSGSSFTEKLLDRIDTQVWRVVLAHMHRQPLREVADRSLGRRVSWDVGQRAKRAHARYVQDGPALAGGHLPAERLRRQNGAQQVQVQYGSHGIRR